MTFGFYLLSLTTACLRKNAHGQIVPLYDHIWPIFGVILLLIIVFEIEPLCTGLV